MTAPQSCCLVAAARFSRRGSINGNRNRVGLCPGFLAAGEVQAVHSHSHLAPVHVDEKVMVVHSLTLERIARGAFDGIGMCSTTTGNEVSNAAVLMPLIVVNVS